MKKVLFFLLLIVLTNNLFAYPIFNGANDSLDKKNIVGANFSLLRTPRISFYLSNPSPVAHEFFLSYRTEIFYYRKLKRNFFVGAQLGYTDIRFRGNDIYFLHYMKSDLNYKLIVSNLSLIKKINLVPRISINPQFDIGVVSKINDSQKYSFYKNSSFDYSYDYSQENITFHLTLILSLQCDYHLSNNNRIYWGYGISQYSIPLYSGDYLSENSPYTHNFNFGFRHAF